MELKYMVNPETQCWDYQGRLNDKGYGKLRYEGKMWRAHRLSYTLAQGPIPQGLHVLHFCDNPACINPEHLFLGTHLDNMRDKAEKGRGTRKLSPQDISQILLLPASLKNQEIAERYGVHHSTISQVRRAHGQPHRAKILTEEQTLRVRFSNERPVDLARELGVTSQAICRVRKRQRLGKYD